MDLSMSQFLRKSKFLPLLFSKFYLFYLQELYKFRYLSGPYKKLDNNGVMLYPGSKNQEAHPY